MYIHVNKKINTYIYIYGSMYRILEAICQVPFREVVGTPARGETAGVHSEVGCRILTHCIQAFGLKDSTFGS